MLVGLLFINKLWRQLVRSCRKRAGGNLDTNGRVCDVLQIHVVEVETEREAGLAHAEITGTRSWAEEKERKREKYINWFSLYKKVRLNYK